jgi:hypothetical protein
MNGSVDVRHSSKKSRNTSRSVAKITLSKDALRGLISNSLGRGDISLSTPHNVRKATMAALNNAVRPPIGGMYRNSMSTI